MCLRECSILFGMGFGFPALLCWRWRWRWWWLCCWEIITRSSAIIMHNFGALFKHRQFDTVCACTQTHKLDRIAWLLGLMCAHDWGLCSLTFFSLMFHVWPRYFSLLDRNWFCALMFASFFFVFSHIIRFFMSCCLHLPILLTVRRYNGKFLYISSWRLLAVVTVANRNYFFSSPSDRKFVKIQILIDWRKVSVYYISLGCAIKILIQEMRRCKLSARRKNAISIMTWCIA